MDPSQGRGAEHLVGGAAPGGVQGTWRDLPGLLADSVRLVWSAGRNVFLVTSALQLLTAVGVAVQLFIEQAVLRHRARCGREPLVRRPRELLAALVAITVALDLSQAIQNEQSRVLGELVSRRALDRGARRRHEGRPARIRVP